MNLALFDFDGTISTCDSFLLFTRFMGPYRYGLGCLALSIRIAGYLARVYPNYALKEDFLTYFYKNKSLKELRVLANRFCDEKVPSIVRPGALERINWHKNHNDVVVIVSACPRLILEPWCRGQGLEILATELELDRNSIVTGKIDGENCWGKEKFARIKSHYNTTHFNSIFAYGDSRGDTWLLRMAAEDKRFYKPFR